MCAAGMGMISCPHAALYEVGIGSRSQEVSGELDKSVETSSMVAGWKHAG